jgi:DNA-binding transcriptional LysR family regulator
MFLRGLLMGGDLSLNQLRAFYYAAACGSITRAAEKLYITQPAVSMQIKALETQFRVQLLVRNKKKLELTDTGKQLFMTAKKIFSLVQDAEKVLVKAEEVVTQVLKIGSTKTLVRHMLAPYISTFQKAFPRIQIQVDEGSSEEMVRSVLSEKNDLAIVGRVPYDERLDVIPFTEDEVVLLAGPGHPLCQKERVSINDLIGENLILRERGSGTRRLVEQVLEGTPIIESAFVQTANVDFVKELVRIGDGITMLAHMGVDNDVAQGHLKMLPVVEGPFILHIDVVINKERTLSQADEAFLNVLLRGEKNLRRYRGPTVDDSLRSHSPASGNRAADLEAPAAP